MPAAPTMSSRLRGDAERAHNTRCRPRERADYVLSSRTRRARVGIYFHQLEALMRGKSTPPRQPLSQRRPKTAANAAKSRVVGKPPAKKSSRKSATKIPSRAKAPVPAGSLPVSDGHKPSRARAARLPAVSERAPVVYDLLAKEYPDAKCALDFRNPYELLVATIL